MRRGARERGAAPPQDQRTHREVSGRHQHHFIRLDEPIQAQGGTFEQVRIGRNSWIGNSTVVMADIGDDCVIGAGSVVVKPIPARGSERGASPDAGWWWGPSTPAPAPSICRALAD